MLQRFKAADKGDTGYINEEQYLQVSLYTNAQSQTHKVRPKRDTHYECIVHTHPQQCIVRLTFYKYTWIHVTLTSHLINTV